LLNQKAILQTQKTVIEDKIKKLPTAQQKYIDLFRDLEISQALYSELNNRRLSFSIREASTLGNIRVVDYAYVESVVSPQITTIFGVLILSLIIAIIGAIFRGLFFIPISNPAELADSYINNPIIGVIPKLDDLNANESEAMEKERLNQSLESVILNLNNLAEARELDNLCILITSPTPSNGKSLMSRLIARKYAKLGKKTLLMDCDYKRGGQAKEFNVQKISQSEFLNINEGSLSAYNVDDNLYLIPKISRLASSFQFLYTNSFIEKIKFFKEQFDVIIIDTSPFLSVSDTGVLMTHSDFNLAIVRHGLTKINEIRQLLNQTNQIGINYDGIVYNSYEKPSSYYGYYGLYGNYSYQYYAQKYLYNSYDYDK
jgi:tyrosine-protein kinase Etk/Wzc